jgi:ribonuclease-3
MNYEDELATTTGAGGAEVKIYNPWNLSNRVIPDGEILRILRMFGVRDRPNRWDLFRQACVHCSYVDRPEGPSAVAAAVAGEPVVVAPRPPECLPLQKADNEAIEFVGDSILGCVIALYLHERYPDQDEGFLTPLRSRLVNNKQLGHLAIRLGFSRWIIVSRHVEDICQGRRNLRILGSMLEAWVGALYLDLAHKDPGRAFDRVKQWLINLYESKVSFCDLIAEDNNFKDQLLKYYQANYHQPPRYKEVAVEGPIHFRTFTMGVVGPDGAILATATARNKKVAEQEASRRALIHLGILSPDPTADPTEEIAAPEEVAAAEAAVAATVVE